METDVYKHASTFMCSCNDEGSKLAGDVKLVSLRIEHSLNNFPYKYLCYIHKFRERPETLF